MDLTVSQTWSAWFPSLMMLKQPELMNALNTQGRYELTDFDTEILDLFAAEYATEAETAAEKLACLWGWFLHWGSHTAVASAVYKNTKQRLVMRPDVIASTAGRWNSSGCGGSCNWTILSDFEKPWLSTWAQEVAVPPAVDGLETASSSQDNYILQQQRYGHGKSYLGL